jgi:hypothetical protein
LLKYRFAHTKPEANIMLRRIQNGNKAPPQPKSDTQPEKDIEFGEDIAKILTSLWNSQDKPRKIYVKGYRIHHGAIGFIGALACTFLRKPTAYGFFKHLADDDKHDAKEWFARERLRN